MRIVCCSDDAGLVEKVRSLSDDYTVVSEPFTSLFENGPIDADIVLVDGKQHRISADKRLTFPLIFLCEEPAFLEAVTLLQCGVRGYGNRMMRTTNLKQAIESVSHGQIWLQPNLVGKLIDIVGAGMVPKTEVDSREELLSSLSKREQEVALYVAQGMSNQEMADKMFVSLRTVKAHLSSIYDKTGIRNRLELGLALVD